MCLYVLVFTFILFYLLMVGLVVCIMYVLPFWRNKDIYTYINCLILVHHAWKISPHYLVKCRTFYKIEVRPIWFSAKIWQLWKNNSWLWCCPETWISDNLCQSSYRLRYIFILIYHHAVIAFSTCLNKELARILCMLCCFTASGTYARSFCEFTGAGECGQCHVAGVRG